MNINIQKEEFRFGNSFLLCYSVDVPPAPPGENTYLEGEDQVDICLHQRYLMGFFGQTIVDYLIRNIQFQIAVSWETCI